MLNMPLLVSSSTTFELQSTRDIVLLLPTGKAFNQKGDSCHQFERELELQLNSRWDPPKGDGISKFKMVRFYFDRSIGFEPSKKSSFFRDFGQLQQKICALLVV